MTINKLNVKIQRLSNNGFSLFIIPYKSMVLWNKIFTTLMKLAFKWVWHLQQRLLALITLLVVLELCSQVIKNG